MAFRDYSVVPASNTTLGDGTFIGPNMLRNKVRPALQQIAADGKEIYNDLSGRIDALPLVPNPVTLKVGNPSLFGYADNAIAQIYRNAGTPVGMQDTFRVVTSVLGDNTTYRGATNALFVVRDADGVTTGTKGAGNALRCSIVPSLQRNNVPFDDMNCLALSNDSGVTSARGTDCIYLAENPLFTAAGTDDFYSGFTNDSHNYVNFQIRFRPSSGRLMTAPNDSYIYFSTTADASLGTPRRALGLATDNALLIGDSGMARADVVPRLNLVNGIKGTLGNYANDAAAATGGVEIGQWYRNGSVVQVRVA